MSGETFTMTYLIIGVAVAFINGAIRKIEADALLGLAWVLVWPMTPLGMIIRGIIYVVEALKSYQPCRRTKIYFLKKF